MCRDCLEKAKNKTKTRQAEFREQGLCVDCGSLRDSEKKTCLKCLQRRNRKSLELRNEVISHYGGRCSCCGETEDIFLCIDHMDNDGGKHRRSIENSGGIHFYRWLKKHNYPDRFQVLCWNCNSAKAYRGQCPHQKSVFKSS
jgi:hypothetical protein